MNERLGWDYPNSIKNSWRLSHVSPRVCLAICFNRNRVYQTQQRINSRSIWRLVLSASASAITPRAIFEMSQQTVNTIFSFMDYLLIADWWKQISYDQRDAITWFDFQFRKAFKERCGKLHRKSCNTYIWLWTGSASAILTRPIS